MTEAEAGRVLATVLLGSAQRERSPEELALMRRYLLPLPFDPVMRRIELHVAQVGRGRDGKATHAWITTPGELLEACGISDTVAAWVVRAMRDGGEVLPDLRSMEGWSYVAANAPKPRGVLEAQAVALEAPPAQNVPALPAARPALIRDVDGKIAAIVGQKCIPREEPERKAPPAAWLESQLAAADARFNAELARIQAAQRGKPKGEEDFGL